MRPAVWESTPIPERPSRVMAYIRESTYSEEATMVVSERNRSITIAWRQLRRNNTPATHRTTALTGDQLNSAEHNTRPAGAIVHNS